VSSEQDPQWRIVSALKNSVLDTHLDVISIKWDVRSIISLVFSLVFLSIINFLLLVYCVCLLAEDKPSTTINRAVQIEANQ
jgi:hypothetical protein